MTPTNFHTLWYSVIQSDATCWWVGNMHYVCVYMKKIYIHVFAQRRLISLEIPEGLTSLWETQQSEQSMKSLWSFSPTHSSNSPQMSGVMYQAMWKSLKWCLLLFRVRVLRSGLRSGQITNPFINHRIVLLIIYLFTKTLYFKTEYWEMRKSNEWTMSQQQLKLQQPMFAYLI